MATMTGHYTWRRALPRIAGRLLLTGLIGESAAGTVLVMFPSMRLRRAVALGCSVVVLRALLRLPGRHGSREVVQSLE